MDRKDEACIFIEPDPSVIPTEINNSSECGLTGRTRTTMINEYSKEKYFIIIKIAPMSRMKNI